MHLEDRTGPWVTISIILHGLRTLERVFELDVGFVTPPAALLLFGHRVHGRFEHPREPQLLIESVL